MKICCKCNQPPKSEKEDPTGETELRPYGPDGAPICFNCAMKPENIQTTEQQLKKKLDAAGSCVVIGGPEGPQSGKLRSDN